MTAVTAKINQAADRMPQFSVSQTLFTTKLDKINQPLHYNGSEFKLARGHASASASINGKSSFINFCSGLVWSI